MPRPAAPATPLLSVLADGRELRYYDDRPGERTAPADRRPAEPRQPVSELRLDRMLDEWVVVAAHRQARTHLPSTDDCPLCPSTPTQLTEVPAAAYDVVVFENRFPALDGVAPVPPGVRRAPASGRCEVVCFTSDHTGSYGTLPPERLRTLGWAWADRVRELSAMPAVEQVLVFENRGQEIGVTLDHPHGQIYAYPFLSPRARRQLEVARAHHERTGQCLGCDVLAEEEAGVRLVAATERSVAYVPEAARWPYEVHVVPRRHVSDLAGLDPDDRVDLMALSARVVRAFDGLFRTPCPYIAAWQSGPTRYGAAYSHLYQQVFTVRRADDKLKYLAGSESAAGVFVNDITPEAAAERLRVTLP